MTNSERIAANNTRLSKLVETAESLPDAGSGGGGVETCTFQFVSAISGYICAVTTYKDGAFVPVYITGNGNYNVLYGETIENVVCNSTVSIAITSSNSDISNSTGLEILDDYSYVARFITAKIVAKPGETAVFDAYQNID